MLKDLKMTFSWEIFYVHFTLQYNVTSFLIIIKNLFKYLLICKSYFKHILKKNLLLRTCKEHNP